MELFSVRFERLYLLPLLPGEGEERKGMGREGGRKGREEGKGRKKGGEGREGNKERKKGHREGEEMRWTGGRDEEGKSNCLCSQGLPICNEKEAKALWVDARLWSFLVGT